MVRLLTMGCSGRVALLALVIGLISDSPTISQEKEATDNSPPTMTYNGFGAVAISPNGKWFAASGAPGTIVRVWDTTTGKEIAVLRGHDSEVRIVVASRDGKRLFAATTTEFRVWDVTTGKQLQLIGAGPNWQYDRLTLSANEKWFLSSPDMEAKLLPDGRTVMARIQLWQVDGGKETGSFQVARTTAELLGQYADFFVRGKGSDAIQSTALSHDGKWVVAGTERGELHLWNAATGKKERSFGRSSDVWAKPLGFSKDGKWIIEHTDTVALQRSKDPSPGLIRIWEVATGKERHTIPGPDSLIRAGGNLFEVAFGTSLSDDGKFLLTGHKEQTVKIWDLESGKELRTFAGHKKNVKHAFITRDNSELVTYDGSGTARLWNVKTGKEIHTEEIGTPSDKVGFSADASYAVVWSTSRLAVWDLKNGKELHSIKR